LNTEEVEQPEEQPEELPAGKAITYLTTWKLTVGNETLATRSLTRCVGSGVFYGFISWMEKAVGEYGKEGYRYESLTTHASASYEKLPVAQWMTARVYKSLDCKGLDKWFAHKCTGN
jgi:hypothetical protein